MQSSVPIYLPTELGVVLRMQEKEVAEEILRLALVKLFELGKISSGKAAEILGITRLAFLEVLTRYGVDWFNDTHPDTLKQDLENA